VKGDFSRLTFRPNKHYAAVLMQQGRVQLDTDWNEQAAILREAVRAVARDLVGPHGGAGNGFSIQPYQDAKGRLVKGDFLIEAGSYYVDGIRCENPEAVSYRANIERLGCEQEPGLEPGSYLAYLDVWQRVVTSLEDPELRESALGGPDTSLRLQVDWRVRLLRFPASGPRSPERALEEAFARAGKTGMRARADPGAGYAGPENHLYRVEIHSGGRAGEATYKWSRDNGSVIAAIVRFEPDVLVIEPELAGSTFDVGMWIEPENKITAICGSVSPLLRIDSVVTNGLITSPSWPLDPMTPESNWIRRWDHGAMGDPEREGAVPLTEGRWLELEDGIQIEFDEGGDYRQGDYWVFAARTADNSIDWPTDSGDPPYEPSGVDHEHRRAPLALVDLQPDRIIRVLEDVRRVLRPLDCPP
jgi:hypothetical protein